MPRKVRCPYTPDIFDELGNIADPVERFEEVEIQHHNIAGEISKLISAVLREQAQNGISREEVVARMNNYLDDEDKTTIDSLKNWAAPSNGKHHPNIIRIIALMNATKSRKFIQYFADIIGAAVVPPSLADRLALSVIDEKIEALQSKKKELEAKK